MVNEQFRNAFERKWLGASKPKSARCTLKTSEVLGGISAMDFTYAKSERAGMIFGAAEQNGPCP